MKTFLSVLSICLITNLSAQTTSEPSTGSNQKNESAVNVIERALTEIDSSLSAITLKIDNNIHDTANFRNLRRRIEILSNKLNAATKSIDQKLVNLFPEEKKKPTK